MSRRLKLTLEETRGLLANRLGESCPETRPMSGLNKLGLYRNAVEWIANNDDAGCLVKEEVALYLTTALVADTFGTSTHKVATDVIKIRKQR